MIKLKSSKHHQNQMERIALCNFNFDRLKSENYENIKPQ